MNDFEKMAQRLRFIAQDIEASKDGRDDKIQKLFRKYKFLLNKVKDRDGMAKLEMMLENPRLKKKDIYWARKFDMSKSKSKLDVDRFLEKFKKVYRRNLPVSSFTKKILDYGLENGHQALNNMLKRKRVKMEILGEDKK